MSTWIIRTEAKVSKWLGFLPQQWHLEHYSSQQSWVWGLAGACQRIRITCEEPHRKTCGKGQPINKTVPKYEGVWAWLTAHTSSLGCFQRPRPLTVSLPWATTAHWGSLTGALATLGCSCSTLWVLVEGRYKLPSSLYSHPKDSRHHPWHSPASVHVPEHQVGGLLSPTLLSLPYSWIVVVTCWFFLGRTAVPVNPHI